MEKGKNEKHSIIVSEHRQNMNIVKAQNPKHSSLPANMSASPITTSALFLSTGPKDNLELRELSRLFWQQPIYSKHPTPWTLSKITQPKPKSCNKPFLTPYYQCTP